VASSTTAVASATPRIFTSTKSPSANAPNTTTMIDAALVITRPDRPTPLTSAAPSDAPRCRASATRESRKTS